MWKDENDERLGRYKKVLQDSPLFFKAAEAAAGKIRESGSTADETVENVRNYVLAPALCSYVLWILNETLKRNIQRIYFLARDAYFMYIAAGVFCSTFNLQIDCRYLSCSRFSLRIPLYHLDFDEALDYICLGGIDVTITKILNRAGLDQHERAAVIENLRRDCSFKYGDDELIPYAELGNVRKTLEKCQCFAEYTIKKSESAFPLLKGYLEQEGLTDGIPFMLVDSGWGGSTQKSLNKAVSCITGTSENFEGCYWGLYELPVDVNPEKYHCYYFSPGYNIQEKTFFSNCLFETVFSAPHGMTLGYRFENGVYFPVYSDVPVKFKESMERTREDFECFIRELLFYAEKNGTSCSTQDKFAFLVSQTDKKVIYKLFKIFMGEPSEDEALVFGCLHFSDDVVDYGQQMLAADLSQAELKANHVFSKALILLGLKNGFLRESAWYEASAVAGRKNVKWHLMNYRAYKRLLYIRKKLIWRKMYGNKQ